MCYCRSVCRYLCHPNEYQLPHCMIIAANQHIPLYPSKTVRWQQQICSLCQYTEGEGGRDEERYTASLLTHTIDCNAIGRTPHTFSTRAAACSCKHKTIVVHLTLRVFFPCSYRSQTVKQLAMQVLCIHVTCFSGHPTWMEITQIFT